MSPAVFSIRASMVRFAALIRWFTPAGTASRTARRSAARRRSRGSASSVSASTPARSSSAAEARRAALSRASIAAERSLNLLEGLRPHPFPRRAPAARAARARVPSGTETLLPRVGAVLADNLERPAIHVLDRARIDSVRSRRVCHVAIDASRSALTSASPCASAVHGIHASTMFGAGDSVLNVICVITPSVPSDPMKRSMRSMSGAA